MTSAASLREHLESGSANYIQNQNFTAQPASFHIDGTLRMGSETGSTQQLVDTADNIVMLDCQVQYSHPNANNDEAMSVQLPRTSCRHDLGGFVTSTTNQ